MISYCGFNKKFDHVFTCLLAICITFFVRFLSFAHFFLFDFYLNGFTKFFIHKSPLSDRCTQMFFLHLQLTFFSLNNHCWWNWTILILIKFNVSIFIVFLGGYFLKNLCLFQRYILLCSLLKFLFLNLSHLDLQSFWNSFCLWYEVGIKIMHFFQQKYPVHPISRSYLSHCIAVSPLS